MTTTEDLSKLGSYAIVNQADERLSKSSAYAIVNQIDERLSKSSAYAIVKQADVRISKIATYAFLVPNAAPPAPKHRYWRVNVTSTAAGNPASIAEIYLAEVGGPNLTGTGIAAAQTFFSGFPPSNAFDLDETTFWASDGSGLPCWISYDFGPGIGYNIADVRIRARDSTPSQSPSTFTVDFSDDNSTWTTKFSITEARTWQGGDIICYGPSTTPITGKPRYWRLNVTNNVDITGVAMSELVLANAVGGSATTGFGEPLTSSIFDGSHTGKQAIDNSVSTFWSSNGSPPQSFIYDFGPGQGVAISEVRITARTDSHATQSPGNFTLDYSDDRVTWTTKSTFVAGAWTLGSSQTFDVPVSTGQSSVALILIV